MDTHCKGDRICEGGKCRNPDEEGPRQSRWTVSAGLSGWDIDHPGQETWTVAPGVALHLDDGHLAAMAEFYYNSFDLTAASIGIGLATGSDSPVSVGALLLAGLWEGRIFTKAEPLCEVVGDCSEAVVVQQGFVWLQPFVRFGSSICISLRPRLGYGQREKRGSETTTEYVPILGFSLDAGYRF